MEEFQLRPYTKLNDFSDAEKKEHSKTRQYKAYRSWYIKKQQNKLQLKYYEECYDEFVEVLENDKYLDSDDEEKLCADDVNLFEENISFLAKELGYDN